MPTFVNYWCVVKATMNQFINLKSVISLKNSVGLTGNFGYISFTLIVQYIFGSFDQIIFSLLPYLSEFFNA